MAEPLTSEDMFRLRSGWGTSSDPAMRQRWSDHGYAPLTSDEMMRVNRGWGASPLASREDRDAMIAYEASAGMRPMIDTPEEYGGMPLGNTRRNIRMRNDWAYRQQLIEKEEKRKQEAIAARIAAIKAQKQESIENWKHEVAVRLEDEALTEKAEVTRQSKIGFDILQNTDPVADPDGTIATINSTLAKYPYIDGPTNVAMEARKKMAESHGAGEQKILALEAQTLAQKSGKPIESMIKRYDTDGTPIYDKKKTEFIKTQIEIDKQKKEERDKVVGPYEQVIAKSNLAMEIIDDQLQNMGPAVSWDPEAKKLINQKREWEMRRSDAEIKKDLATLPRINSLEELKNLNLNVGDRYIAPNGTPAAYSGKTLAPPPPPVYATGPVAEPLTPTTTAPAVQQLPVTAPIAPADKSKTTPEILAAQRKVDTLSNELEAMKQASGLSQQPFGVRQINEALSSENTAIRNKAEELRQAQIELNPLAELDTNRAQDVAAALELVYPKIGGNDMNPRFDVGNPQDARVMAAAMFLQNVRPEFLRMVANDPGVARGRLSLKEIDDIVRSQPSASGNRTTR